jgi:hypothetical protein
MVAAILLLLTVFCAYVTFDAFRLRGSIKDAPFSAIAGLWGNRGDHLSLAEQAKIKDRYRSFVIGAGKLALIFLVVTVVLAIATVRAFLE